MTVKLGDFGLATKLNFDGEKKRTVCGTPNYIAPEILDGKCGHSYEVDVWSLGVIIYTLLIGKPPFETSDVKSTYKKIKLNSYSFPESVPISASAKSLIESILQSNPTKRPTIDEIYSHPFLNKGNSIPKLLPVSTLACPPSASYLRKYLNSKTLTENELEDVPIVKSSTIKENLTKSSNVNTINLNNKLKEKKDFVNTDRSNKPIATATNLLGEINTNYYEKEKKNEILQTKDNFTKTQQESSTKWVDYSSKYGLGYLLSNGAAGVCFNDATKIISLDNKNNNKQDIPHQYTFDSFPKDLQKKITLLQHFKNYLENEKDSKPAIPLSVVFQDSTEIILSSELKLVTYVSKKGERMEFPLSIALESTNKEMTKRLKYTKEILTQMIGGNTNNFENCEENPALLKKTETDFGKSGPLKNFAKSEKLNF